MSFTIPLPRARTVLTTGALTLLPRLDTPWRLRSQAMRHTLGISGLYHSLPWGKAVSPPSSTSDRYNSMVASRCLGPGPPA